MPKKSSTNRFLFAAILFSFIPFLTYSQNPTQFKGAEMTYGTKLGRVESLRESQERLQTDREKLKAFKENKPFIVPNFMGRRRLEHVAEGALPVGQDPVRQSGTERAVERIVDPIVVFEGLDQNLAQAGVPDVNGDVSAEYYVQTVNSTLIQTFDHEGNKIGSPINANLIWAPLQQSSAGDPVILFDKGVNRWFLTEFPPSNRVLVAISDTEDPLGGWTVYAFVTPRFPDYPKYGIWPEAYVLTTNEGGGGTIKFYFINRADILNGKDQVRIQRFTIQRLNEPSFQVASPVDWIGQLEPEIDMGPMIARINDDGWGSSDEDILELYEGTIDWENEANTAVEKIEIPLQPFDSEFCSVAGPGFSCVPQPNGIGIDGIPWVIMHKIQYRNFGTHSSMVMNFTVDASGDDIGGIRWLELRKMPGGDWELYQEGTYAPDDGHDRFMGGISIDSEGNIGLAYSISGDDKHPSLRYTGRRHSDPLGMMTVREVEFATGAGSIDHDRFGDYASMSVDQDDVFWYAGEYLPSNGSWSTKIVAYKILADTHDLAPVRLVLPENSPDLTDAELVSIEIENQGMQQQDSFYVGYIVEDQDPVIELVELDSLPRDSFYTHTFLQTVDMSEIGPYSFRLFSDLWNDQNIGNDTIEVIRMKLPFRDARLPAVLGLESVTCDTSVSVNLVLQNNGQDTLFSARVIGTLDGNMPDTVEWEGVLAFGESEILSFGFEDLSDGDHLFQGLVENPNGIDDQVPANDTIFFPFRVQGKASLLIFEIRTDDFPEETTWDLKDKEGEVLYSGGPYPEDFTTYFEEFCLDTSECFTFTIYDSFGDGLTGGQDGNYQIYNSDGVLLATLLNPAFGNDEENNFCGNLNCQLRINALVAHESMPGVANGTINVFANSGLSPLQYSINGGQSFQPTSFFSGLSPAQYIVYVKDATGCIALDTINILACDMEIMANILGVSEPDSADGAIGVLVSGNNGNLMYSIDGGPFQAEAEFYGVSFGSHTVVVRDSVKCQVTGLFEVGIRTATQTPVAANHFVKISPNPSDAAFHIEIYGAEAISELKVDVTDLQGRVVARGMLGNYSGVLRGLVSMRSEAPGMYLLRIHHENFDKMYRLIKH